MFELLFGAKRNTAPAVAEPVDEVTARKAFLLDEIARLDTELQDHEGAERAFRLKNLCVINGRSAIIYAKGGDPGIARADVEKRWAALCKQREEIQKKRNSVLQELGKFS